MNRKLLEIHKSSDNEVEMNADIQRKCPLCEQLDYETHPSPSFSNPNESEPSGWNFWCLRCGNFKTDRQAQIPGYPQIPEFLKEKGIEDVNEANDLLKRYLSIYTRECTESGITPNILENSDQSILINLAETYTWTPVSKKAEKLLSLIKKRTKYPGTPGLITLSLDYPAIHAVAPEEILFFLHFLREQGLITFSNIESQILDGAITVPNPLLLRFEPVMTVLGWDFTSQQGNKSQKVFVAMSFKEEYIEMYRDGLKIGIEKTGYAPLRIDEMEHVDKICDKIISAIKESRFLVAEVSDPNPGVYYEAGFAMGKGIPVIWVCQKNKVESLHFDTRQYNHILYSDSRDLQSRIYERIKALDL
ncbi:MAG: hypothetical protein ACYCVG_05565 [Leptospirillum sp.]